MALTQRGKVVIGVVVAAVVAVLALLAFTGNAPAPIQSLVDTVTSPDPCPLTGEERANGKDAPVRPMIAVKIENAPEARPQAGLDDAEVVFEEPVEGGLTRFIALYHCGGSGRLGPIRSARLTDPDVLAPFGRSLFAYAGGADPVKEAIEQSDLVDLSYLIAVDAYERDEGRAAPHNLYSSTVALRRAGHGQGEQPAEVFVFSETFEGKSRRAGVSHLPFSSASDVVWSWSRRADGWLRSHGDEPHVSETGDRIRADTVVVMHVKVQPGEIRDAAGNPSPEVTLTGDGRVWILREGRVVRGRWERASLSDPTRFLTRDGEEIPLRPGTTWIELLPLDVDPEFIARV
ncbi:MAG TPA: DUF3048 domain-containing protein [Actinomycetota bacterium]|nr:DUF3048 domain-containing protein [Actinomycetota bacterium]